MQTPTSTALRHCLNGQTKSVPAADYVDAAMISDLTRIVDRLKSGGQLTPNELSEIRERLKNPDTNELSQLARALSLGTPPSEESIKLLEPFLSVETDDWALHGVIVSLCHDWQLASRYVSQLTSIAQVINWDAHQSAVIWAFSAFADYLEVYTDLVVLNHIFRQIGLANEWLGRTQDLTYKTFGDAAWYPIDRWQRGKKAIFPRTELDTDSEMYQAAERRYLALVEAG